MTFAVVVGRSSETIVVSTTLDSRLGLAIMHGNSGRNEASRNFIVVVFLFDRPVVPGR